MRALLPIQLQTQALPQIRARLAITARPAREGAMAKPAKTVDADDGLVVDIRNLPAEHDSAGTRERCKC